jgi:hypothetical protein
MRVHKPDVIHTFSTLAYLVKTKDTDGIELCFTTSPRSMWHRNKHTTPLVEALRRIGFSGQSDIAYSLPKVLREYDPKPNKKKNRLSKLFSKEKWGVNIYVFTDGVWEAGESWLDGVVEAIKDLLDKGMKSNQMGIEFVQFGDDTEGTRRLQMLDDDLRNHGVKK